VSQRCALPQNFCKTLCPSIADLIEAEIEVSQRCALPQHSCKTLCTGTRKFDGSARHYLNHSITDPIAAEIEVSQRWALRQHCCKTLCPVWSDVISTEIKVHQRSALRQHSSCKPLCMWSCNCTAVRPAAAAQIECGDAARSCHRRELPQNELALFLYRARAGVFPEPPAQADNGWQAHLVH
jgi:hypothetical protein